jgi:spore germination protein KC
MLPQIAGTAFFKHDKLAGFLSGEETKYLMFIKNKVKGGLLIEGTQENGVSTPVSLEIFKSKTQVKPIVDDKGIKVNLKVDATVAIAEIEGTENFIDGEGRKKLQQSAEKKLKKEIESLIKKMQSKYDVDIFGFGVKLRESEPEVWNQVSSNWEEVFKNVEVNVTTKIRIKNSALLSKPLKKGD